MTFGFSDGSRNFLKLFSVSWRLQAFWHTFLHLVWRFCFLTRIRLNPLSSEILYHDCVPVILSWFTSFIVWSAVIKSPNFSARSGASPVCLLQGAFVILVLKQTSQSRSFGEVSKHTVLSRSHSGELCADACNSVSFRFSLKSFNQSGRSANGSSESFLSLLFFLWFWISENGTSVPVASSSLRSDTELEDELEAGSNSSLVAVAASFLKESCDSDAEDELLAGLVDNPCTTRGTKLSMTIFSSWVNRGLRKACPAIGLLAFPPVIARLRTDWDCERTLVPLRGFAPPRLQSTLLSRFWSFLLCPSLLSLILFCSSCASMLLNQLRNSRSSGLVEVGAGIPFSIGVQNVALSEFLSLLIFFAKSHAALRAHLSWCEVSPCDPSPNFGTQGLRSWGAHFWIIPRDGPFLSRILKWCQVPWEKLDGVLWSQISRFT